jgi:putative oxidoreductase
MRRMLADNGIFLLRISVSLLMLSHGVPKALEYETLVAEIGCSILLLLGLLGRFASVTLFIAMMVAVFVHHFGDVWSMRELPLLYASVYATLTLTGPGSPSFDAWFSRQVFEREEPSVPKPRRAEPGAPT